MPADPNCKTCRGQGWVRRGERIVECPRCLGPVRVEDLPDEDRKS
jgi:hypothetical protein